VEKLDLLEVSIPVVEGLVEKLGPEIISMCMINMATDRKQLNLNKVVLSCPKMKTLKLDVNGILKGDPELLQPQQFENYQE